MLKSKIHRATVTDADVNYEGSITIDPELMETADILPFEQVDRTASRRYQGTGLGLSLSKKLVELHGGKIWVESDGTDRGCNFSFLLPVDPS